MDFATWLARELDQRGWSRSEAARRGGITSVAVDRVINGQMRPGVKFVRAIAKAFGMAEEDVMREAGLLPKVGQLPPRLQDLVRRAVALPEVDRDGVIDVFEVAVSVAERRLQGQ